VLAVIVDGLRQLGIAHVRDPGDLMLNFLINDAHRCFFLLADERLLAVRTFAAARLGLGFAAGLVGCGIDLRLGGASGSG
jgi:hypothetical protein